MEIREREEGQGLFRGQEGVKEKNSKNDTNRGNTTVQDRRIRRIVIKNPVSVDVRVDDIRVYYTNSHIRNKIDLLRGLVSV